MTAKSPFEDNPFAENEDIDATVMQPVAFRRPAPDLTPPAAAAAPARQMPPPGSAPLPAAPAFAQPAAQSAAHSATHSTGPGYGTLDDATVAAMTAVGDNPLVTAATPILSLVVRVRDLAQHRDVESLRERVIGEMRRFEAAATRAGLTAGQIRNAGYALCATIDDVVLNTPWGSQSVWAHRSMVSTIQKETWGGERFFDLLDQMAEQPGRHIRELELFYLCLSLGFEGKYRVMPRGHSELGRLRDRLYRLIRKERGDSGRDLSGRWQGVAERFRPPEAMVPLWVPAGMIAALLVALFVWFAYSLGEQSDAAYGRLAKLLPDRPVQIGRLTPPPTLPAAAPVSTLLQRVSAFLATEIRSGMIEVQGDQQGRVIVRTLGNVFASGSDAVEMPYRILFGRVAEAIRNETGTIQVIGHTDNVAIRSIRFPSNEELSEARAEQVRLLLAQGLGGSGRLSAEGRGDTEPIASNATPQGRQSNRRIDIVLAP